MQHTINGTTFYGWGMLKPCPFCGSAPMLCRDGGAIHKIKCFRCGAAPFASIDRDKVVNNWNRRKGRWSRE